MITAVRAFRARPRLLVSTLVAIAAVVLLPARFALSSRLLLAWDAGASLYLILLCHDGALRRRRYAPPRRDPRRGRDLHPPRDLGRGGRLARCDRDRAPRLRRPGRRGQAVPDRACRRDDPLLLALRAHELRAALRARVLRRGSRRAHWRPPIPEAGVRSRLLGLSLFRGEPRRRGADLGRDGHRPEHAPARPRPHHPVLPLQHHDPGARRQRRREHPLTRVAL